MEDNKRTKINKEWIKNHKLLSIIFTVFILVGIGVIFGNTDSSDITNSKPTTQSSTPPTEKSTSSDTKQSQPKKDDSELKATVKVATDVPGIEITNNETVNWDECEFKLNDKYSRTLRNPLTPNEPLNNPFGLFTKDDGTRFNITETTIKDMFIKCKVDGNIRYGYYKFNN